MGGLWQISNVLMSLNDGAGIAVRVFDDAPSVFSLGMDKCNVFTNTGRGISVVGSPACTITSFRLKGGFLGADNFHEIYLDIYGGAISIADISMEQSGTQNTGHALQTLPSNAGNGNTLNH